VIICTAGKETEYDLELDNCTNSATKEMHKKQWGYVHKAR
jgi:hypothetical protein